MVIEKIKKIFFDIKNNLNMEMKNYDLTAAQIIVLKYLYENTDNVVILKDICEYLSLKHSTVIGILKRLGNKELITRKTGYTSEIAITKKGRELVESIGVKTGFVEKELLKGFSKDEINNLSSYLDRIINNINNS